MLECEKGFQSRSHSSNRNPAYQPLLLLRKDRWFRHAPFVARHILLPLLLACALISVFDASADSYTLHNPSALEPHRQIVPVDLLLASEKLLQFR